MSVIDVVKKFLLDQEYVIQDEVLDETDSLLERGLIDSVGIINLVSLLEETYRIEIDDDDLMPENFDSLNAIKNYVESKIR
jgi:acyl carrier protein